MKYLLLMLPVVLAGCASSQAIKGADGEDQYLVKCGNAVKSKCTEKAAELCPQGYILVDRKADPYDDQTKVGNAGKLEIKADTTTYMQIQCKH